MKKRVQTLLVACLAVLGTANAQQNGKFFEQVPFKGAMGTEDWTQGWANFRPDTVKYAGEAGGPTKTTVNLNPSDAVAEITTNTTWTSDKVYTISNKVIVKNGVTLTIEPGTVIRGSKNGTVFAGMLIIAQGGKLIANGTKTNPIIFTSGKPVGQRSLGDWGGILLFGKAPQADNGAARRGTFAGKTTEGDSIWTSKYETFENSDPNKADVMFGGIDPQDNSGSISYVRIEFGGWYKVLGEEVNALTMCGVGKGTSLHHIQASFTNDDSFEWYGGNVDAKYLIAFAQTDDCFDTDLGASPRLQFCIGMIHPFIYESGGGTRGIEADGNSDFTYATQPDAKPFSRPVFSNMTLVGPLYAGKTKTSLKFADKYDQGIIIRTNSEAKVFNSISASFPGGGVRIRHANLAITPSCFEKALSGLVKVQNNIISNCDVLVGSADKVPTNVNDGSGAGKFDTKKFIFKAENSNDSTYKNINDLKLTNPMVDTLIVPTSNTNRTSISPNVKPLAGSPVLAGADWKVAELANDSYVNGIEDAFSNGKVSIYPNPSKGLTTVRVELINAAALQVSVYDLLGRLVYTNSSEFSADVQFFTVDGLKSGVYLVKVSDGNTATASRLVVE